jgi:small-conductance mechanosensitive channel/CRP-like cAMP-binding protein
VTLAIRLLGCALVLGGLLLARLGTRGRGHRRRIPRSPLRVPATGLLLWLLAGLPAGALLPGPADWLVTAGRLGLLYAGLSVLNWLVLEIPAALGWWRLPARILRQLALLLLAAALTLLVLQQAGVNLVGLLTTSAVLTAVVGFAAQEPLRDVFGGLTLQFDRPFQEGDWLEVGEIGGRVESLTLMNTYLRSGLDGSILVIPNDTVAQAALRRLPAAGPFGNHFELGLDYGFPPSRALRLLRDVLSRHPDVLASPAPRVWVSRFDDSSIAYGLQAWHGPVEDLERLRIRGELLEQIWYALAREGQSIPFPVREIRPRRRSPDDGDPLEADVGTRAGWLGRNALFADLRPDQRQALAPHTRCLRFAPGELVLRQGESGDALFQVIRGAVEVLADDGSGGMRPVARLGRHQVFGEMALCTNEPRSASVRTVEETVLLEVERRDLQPLIDRDPALVEKLARLVHRRRGQLEEAHRPPDPADSLSENRLVRSMQRLFNVMRGSG